MKKQLVEFIGTFLFVLSIGLIVHSGTTFAPLAIWTALAVLVFASGHLSGGHLNPAVTVWLIVRGKISVSDAVSYIVAQLAGAILAGLVVSFLIGWAMTPGAISDNSVLVILAEALFTFLLVYVVSSTATSEWTKWNSFYGWVIGMAVAVGAFSVGSISGWAFNPAVAIGGIFDGTFAASQVWMHIVWDLLGAVIAALAYNYVDSK